MNLLQDITDPQRPIYIKNLTIKISGGESVFLNSGQLHNMAENISYDNQQIIERLNSTIQGLNTTIQGLLAVVERQTKKIEELTNRLNTYE